MSFEPILLCLNFIAIIRLFHENVAKIHDIAIVSINFISLISTFLDLSSSFWSIRFIRPK